MPRSRHQITGRAQQSPVLRQPRLAASPFSQTVGTRQGRLWRLKLHAAGGAMAAALFLGAPAFAQNAVTVAGDAAVTGFSGVRMMEASPSSGNPLDGYFIDPDGASLTIFKLGVSAAPHGEVINAPAVFKVPAKETGQVFALALQTYGDGTPPTAIFLGATSVFGLNIAVPGPGGNPQRVMTGTPQAAWMDGQFGGAEEGGPGSIWRVDGQTGQVTLFANIRENSGPGIGAIAYDKTSGQLYVSDLDSGLIQRIAANGSVLDSFDHGTRARPAAGLAPLPDDGSRADINSPAFDSTNPATWGFTPRERMVWGLALYQGRLYYAVQGGPEVWSVGINRDGSFGTDARPEIRVDGVSGASYISSMTFDANGRLYLAQRSEFRGSYDYWVLAEPRQSHVLRYEFDAASGRWNPMPAQYAIGFPDGYRNGSGGVALGACGRVLWATGDNLRNNPAMNGQLAAGGPLDVHGLQGNDVELVRPQNEPPLQAVFADYDGQFGDSEKAGHVGAVAVWQECRMELKTPVLETPVPAEPGYLPGTTGFIPPPPRGCPPPYHISHGVCCPPRTEWNGRVCLPPPPRDCPPPLHKSHGECCPPRTEWNGKSCEPPPSHDCPPPLHKSHGECCPPRTEWNGKECGRPPMQECLPPNHESHGACCPPKTEWNGKSCETPPPPPPHKCPPGTTGVPPLCVERQLPPVELPPIVPPVHNPPSDVPPVRIPKCPPGTWGAWPNCKWVYQPPVKFPPIKLPPIDRLPPKDKMPPIDRLPPKDKLPPINKLPPNEKVPPINKLPGAGQTLKLAPSKSGKDVKALVGKVTKDGVKPNLVKPKPVGSVSGAAKYKTLPGMQNTIKIKPKGLGKIGPRVMFKGNQKPFVGMRMLRR